MEQSIITNKTKEMKKEDMKNTLKENIKILFTQLKSGCHRNFCYNSYCAKSLSK